MDNLNRRTREDLARKEQSGDRSSSAGDGSSAAEKVTQICAAADVQGKPPDLPDLIDDIVDDDRTTIDVLPPEVLRALLEEDEALASRPEPRTVPYGEVAEPRTVPYGEVEPPAAEPRTVAYGRLTIARPPADVVPISSRRPPEVASVIAELDADEPMTVMQRRPPAAPVVPAPAAPAAPVAPTADAPPWRVTAQADELRFAAERRSRIVVGSMASCDWVLDHPAVRAVHCELVYEDGWFLSARAPVRFLDLDVQGWTPVASGDVIGIGGAALRLEFARLDDVTVAADAPAAGALPAVAAPAADPAPAAIAPPAPVVAPVKSAAEDAVFRLPEAEDATAARAPSSSSSSSKRAVLGLLVLAALGGLYFTQRAGRSAPKRGPAAAAAAKDAKDATLAATAPATPRPVVTLAEPALATRAAGGVTALLDGNYRAALIAYRKVAAEGGGEAADIFVRALESRLAAPCRRAGRPIKECIP